jgi:hypothetical protein
MARGARRRPRAAGAAERALVQAPAAWCAGCLCGPMPVELLRLPAGSPVCWLRERWVATPADAAACARAKRAGREADVCRGAKFRGALFAGLARRFEAKP